MLLDWGKTFLNGLGYVLSFRKALENPKSCYYCSIASFEKN